MSRPARRQHFIACFYLRNFAEPMFSDNIQVYTRLRGVWEKRTPNGIGWFPHLLTMIDNEGIHTDRFDQFLKKQVEDPATGPLKKMAIADEISQEERYAIALFIAMTAARSLNMMNKVANNYLKNISKNEKEELEKWAKIWCNIIGRKYGPDSITEFQKPGRFGAIWIWAKSFQHRISQWKWHILKTERQYPFITSDQPVYAEWDKVTNFRLVSFPISSEIALIIHNAKHLQSNRDHLQDIRAMNYQTMLNATDFIVSCNGSLIDEGLLEKWRS